MNKQWLLGLLVIPLFAWAITQAKLKGQSPAPTIPTRKAKPALTPFNLNMGNKFIGAKDAVIGMEYFVNHYFENYEHQLSIEERREIAPTLLIAPSKLPYDITDGRMYLNWSFKQESFTINISCSNDEATYSVYKKLGGGKLSNPTIYNLQFSSSRYIRNWVNTRPQVKKELGIP